MEEKQVIVIGAGPAGLTAAYQLLKHSDYKPVILEESEFVGGISRTAVYKNNRMDLGGHRFFTKNAEVMAIWEALMPIQGAPSRDDIILGRDMNWSPGGPDPEQEDRVLLKRNRVSRIFYLRKFFDYPISLKPETFKNMGLARTFKVGLGYLASVIHKREEASLEDFYINRFGKPLYEMFFEDYTEKLWGVHPSNIAPDWGAQRVKGLSLLKVIFSVLAKPFTPNSARETSLIEEFLYPKYGPGQLWETMAGEIRAMGGKIYFNSRVTRIDFNDNTVTNVVAVTKDNEEIVVPGEAVFSSMPVKDLIEAMGDVPPQEVKSIASQLPYRDFITVGLLVNKLLIRNKTKIKTVSNIVPDCWIYIQERDVRLGRMQIFNNWSPYLVADLENTVWVGLEYFCTEGDDKWNMPEESFIEMAVQELERIGVISRGDVLDATIIKVKKAYPAYFGTYGQFDKVKKYLNKIENLFCIGRNGQHRYNNMDHSMLTAIEAVRCFIQGDKDKEVIWSVNTEEEYHESKSNALEQMNEQ